MLFFVTRKISEVEPRLLCYKTVWTNLKRDQLKRERAARNWALKSKILEIESKCHYILCGVIFKPQYCANILFERS